MLPLLLIAAAASAAAGGAAKIGAGILGAKANAASAAAAQQEARNALLRGTQIGEVSKENLRKTLSNIETVRAYTGMSGDSPTAQAIEGQVNSDASRDQAVQVLAELQRAGASSAQARGYRSASRWAIPLAALGATGDFVQAASYGAQAAGGGGGG